MNAFLTSIGYHAWVLPVLLTVPLLGALAIWIHGAVVGGATGAPAGAKTAEEMTIAEEFADPRARDEVVTGFASTARTLALITFAVEFIVSIGLWWAFDPAQAGWQFVFDTHWI